MGHYVGGTMRGSHHGPLMPVKLNSTISFFDGPAVVSCGAFCVHDGKFTEVVDAFDHPFWDWVRNNVSAKAAEIRMQGFSGPAMLPYTELEYGGVVEKMGSLDTRFIVRKDAHAHAAAGNGGSGVHKETPHALWSEAAGGLLPGPIHPPPTALPRHT